jgi:hypothetical protein
MTSRGVLRNCCDFDLTLRWTRLVESRGSGPEPLKMPVLEIPESPGYRQLVGSQPRVPRVLKSCKISSYSLNPSSIKMLLDPPTR